MKKFEKVGLTHTHILDQKQAFTLQNTNWPMAVGTPLN